MAFAYYHRLSPVFHEDIVREAYGVDPFEAVYAVKKDFMLEVIKYVDECDLAGNHDALAFRELEDKFGGYKVNRMEIIFTLEYARIARRFNEKVWDAVQKDAPVEANPLDAKFSPKDVEFH